MIAPLLLVLALAAQTARPQASAAPSTLYWFDFDSDGASDALEVATDGTVRLIHNEGDGSFVEETASRGLATASGVASALVGDYDGDGALDILLTGRDGIQLLRQRAGVFEDVSEPAGLSGLGPAVSASWIEVNADRVPDLYVAGIQSHRVFVGDATGVFREFDLGEVPREEVGPVGGRARLVEGPVTEQPDSGLERGAPDSGGGTTPAGSRRPALATDDEGSGASAAPAPETADRARICAGSVADQAGGGCVEASSVPILGMLYPLSSELYIDSATGNVGVGTTSPAYALEVAGRIVSGAGNSASGSDSAMGGGKLNTASGDQSTVAGGDSNVASGTGAFVGSGLSNLALSDRATIAGGVGNRASYRAFVGGGDTNAALGNVATVAGGKQNDALQTGAFVGGGEQNTADAAHASIAGGFGNNATGNNAVIGGGLSNLATAAYGTIPGGRQNTAAGAYSLAAGRRAKALHDGAFVWADSEDADLASTGPDQFVVRAAGGMGIGKVPDPSFQLDVDGAVRASDTIVSTKPSGAPLSVASSDLNANLNADYLDGLHASAFSQFGGAVDTNELADDAVTGAKIAPGAVGSAELAAGAVTAPALALDSVGAAALAPDSVGASEIASQAVGSDEVADGSLTEADVSFGSLSVTGEIESTSGGIRFPDGSLQTTATTGSGVPTGSMILRYSSIAPSGFTWTGLRVNATRDVSGWQPLAPAPAPVSDHASTRALVGGAGGDWHLFVVGGTNSSGDELASVRSYNLATAVWNTLPSMPLGPRTDLAVIGDRNGPSFHLLAIGGIEGSQELGRVERYDIDAQTWTTRSPMPTARFGVAAVVGSSEVYVIGGEITGDPGSVVDTVESYDDTGDSWTALAPMPTPRSQLALVLVGEQIYAIGGRNQAGMATDVVEIYDIPSNTWSTTFPLPEPRSDAAAVVLGGSIYVIGGETGFASPHGDAFELVPGDASSWSSSPGLELTPVRSGHTLMEFEDSVYSVGGRTPTATDLFEVAASPKELLYVHQKD